MTSIRSAFKALVTDEIPGAPDADWHVSPSSAQEAATVLDLCSEHGLAVRIWGTGTRSQMGNPVAADVVLSTRNMASVIDWQPDDLTVTVEAGHSVDALETMLGARRQSAILARGGTVGGVVATGSSEPRRLRYGPTRDRMLEVVLATGDGRVVHAGGRVVKNVTGFDIARLVTGSFGSLGVICSVTVKLWPLPEAAATVEVDDPERAAAIAYRPLAVLSGRWGARVYLQGTRSEVEGQAAAIGGSVVEGHVWPDEVDADVVAEIRVPPALVTDAVGRVTGPYVAQRGVGIVTITGASDLGSIRSWAESVGGSLVVLRGPADDRWGTPPSTIELQRRVKAAFDPLGVCNPGILPGGV